MPIPSEYQIKDENDQILIAQSMLLWINSVPGKIGEMQSDFSSFYKYWGNLTAQQKTALKAAIASTLNEARDDLTAIITEINGL
jgi:hypothetical protein